MTNSEIISGGVMMSEDEIDLSPELEYMLDDIEHPNGHGWTREQLHERNMGFIDDDVIKYVTEVLPPILGTSLRKNSKPIETTVRNGLKSLEHEVSKYSDSNIPVEFGVALKDKDHPGKVFVYGESDDHEDVARNMHNSPGLKDSDGIRRIYFKKENDEDNFGVMYCNQDISQLNDKQISILNYSHTQFVQSILTAKRLKDIIDEGAKDPLTKLVKSTGFYDSLENRIRRGRLKHRNGESYDGTMVFMADIDHFKSYNDDFGHQAGDDVLVFLARMCANNIRRKDFVSRYGGEEFAFVYVDITKEDGERKANEFCNYVEEISIQIIEFETKPHYEQFVKYNPTLNLPDDYDTFLESRPEDRKSREHSVFMDKLGEFHDYLSDKSDRPLLRPLTISGGTKFLDPDYVYTWEEREAKRLGRKLTKQADQNLYRAKDSGRNRIIHSWNSLRAA